MFLKGYFKGDRDKENKKRKKKNKSMLNQNIDSNKHQLE